MLKKLARWLLVNGWPGRLLRNPVLEMLLPPLVGLYYLTLDVWGDELWFVKDYRQYHKLAFFVLVIITLSVLCLRGIGDWFFGSQRELVRILESLLTVVGNIITAKRMRFRSKLGAIRANSNIFELITHPKDQIRAILIEAQKFFVEQLNIPRDGFDITVLRCDCDGKNGEYLVAANDGWQHTDPAVLLNNESTARECLQTGEERFYALKAAAEQKNRYFVSERDRRHGLVGSIYCSPVFVPMPQGDDKYLITFTTYGKAICDEADTRAADAARMFFREFVKRIEIELTLLSIKSFAWSAKKETKRKKAEDDS